MNYIWIFFCGLCMGAADLVPGISGGTVAFILGIYEHLLESIKSLNLKAIYNFLSLRFRTFFQMVSWKFIAALLSGILFSMVSLAHFFNYILGHEVYRVWLYAGFIGLIAGSVLFCAKQIPKWRWQEVLSFFVGALFAFILTGTSLQFLSKEQQYDVFLSQDVHIQNESHQEIVNYDQQQHMLKNVPASTLTAMYVGDIVKGDNQIKNLETNELNLVEDVADKSKFSRGVNVWIVVCGSIAISAMLLPGISGSYLLTVLGVYHGVIGALADFVHGVRNFMFDSDAFFILLSMLIGILIGALTFSRVVSWLLKTYRTFTIALLIGFMVGALRSVWPFWSYQYFVLPLKLDKGPQLELLQPIVPDVASSLFLLSILFAVFGFLIVYTLETIAARRNG